MEIGECLNELVKTSNCNMRLIDSRSQLFGPYSFINISCGKEEMDDVQCCIKNMVEVAVVTRIVHNMYKGISPSLSCTLVLFVLGIHAWLSFYGFNFLAIRLEAIS